MSLCLSVSTTSLCVCLHTSLVEVSCGQFAHGIGLPCVGWMALRGFKSYFVRFVVVQKRINTRIFQLGGKVPENPAPGTVLDHTVRGTANIASMSFSQVTKRDWYDFFLVSQHVGQGTVSPTHYIVVHDNTGLKPDIIQKVTWY